MVDYSSYRKYKLQAECRRRNLHVSDDRAELMNALRRDDIQYPDAHARASVNFRPFTGNPNIYLAFMQYQLQEYCDERDLQTNGIKWQLAERLLEYDLKLWKEAIAEELTDATDPDFTRREERIRTKSSFTLKQEDVKLAARLDHHQFRDKTIKSTVESQRTAVIQEGKDAEAEFKKLREQKRRREFEARLSASNNEKSLLSVPNSRAVAEDLGETVGQLPVNNTLGNPRLRGTDTKAGENLRYRRYVR
jgi:hypothetical protein